MTNKQLLLAEADHQFVDWAIELSKMVSANRISSTNAKIVFKDIWSQYQGWIWLIEKAVTT